MSLSVIPSAKRMISPRELIARPNASIYNDIPSSDDVNSKFGRPWNARFLVISKFISGAVVKLI